MRSIIQTCIAQMGDEVRLSSDVAEDKKIKDAINSLHESQDLMESLILDPSYKTKLETFLHGKGDLQKLKLAFLFGQLAKRGVLGYEHGTSNRANTLTPSKQIKTEYNKK